MATIHAARHIASNDKTTPLFSLKGLSNLAPGTISSLNIHGIPLERQVAYLQYSCNISAFIHASSIRKTVTVSPSPYGFLESYIDFLPLDPPTVSFTVAKKLSSDDGEKLVSKLGPGANKTISGRTTIFHAPGLPPQILNMITTVSTPFFNAGRDAVNPRGYKAYMFLNNVIMTFLHVHAYPAFRDEDPESITAFSTLLGTGFDAVYVPREETVKDKDGKETKRVNDQEGFCYSNNEFGKRLRDEDDIDMDDEALPKNTKLAAGVFTTRGTETVFRAKPVRKSQPNIGSVNSIPRSMGTVFPYFHGLIQPDAAYMNSMILRRFYQLLGSTHEKCQSRYIDIRHGVNSLASTARGMEIAHMLLGIDLALETQSRCFLIIDNRKYHGFTLLGSRYAIFANSKWFASSEEEDLSLALARMDPHEAAVSDIIDKLKVLASENQYSGNANRSMFMEPQLLVDELAKLSISEMKDEDIRDLDRLVKNLNYMGTGYLSQNPQMIAEMLTTLASAKTIELDRPTYLPTIRAPFNSRVYRALSRFGPEAPSFWNDRGTEIPCKPLDKIAASVSGGKRKLSEKDTYGNMPAKILITPKPLMIAVRDMDRVMEVSKVKMDEKERAGKYRNITLEAEETRKSIWKGLIDVCSTTTKKPRLEVIDDTDGGIAIDDALLKLLG